MEKVVLGAKDLREVVETVKARLANPPAGVELVKENSSGMLDAFEGGTLMVTGDGGVLSGSGQSEFLYSDGLRVNTKWRFEMSAAKTLVMVDQEQVIRPK
ncbi:MAG: hypothetical protein WAV15_00840 [Minisyncoccia bacterium]